MSTPTAHPGGACRAPKRTSRYNHDQITLDAHHKRMVASMSSIEDELDYFVDTGDILFKYYETIKGTGGGSESTLAAEIPVARSASIFPEITPSHGFEKSAPNDAHVAVDGFTWWDRATAGTGSRIYVQSKPDVEIPSRLWTRYTSSSPSIPTQVPVPADSCRVRLLQQFLKKVDANFIDDTVPSTPVEMCSHCGGRVRKTMVSEGMIVCEECDTIEYAITDNDRPSYKEPPKEISYFCYARINHFNEWLNHIQGKETTHIPDDLFDSIMLELKKQRITDMSKLQHKKIRDILKKLRVNKYYEHVPYIIHRITGLPNPHLTPQLEDRLRNMFKEIQVPYVKHAPPARKNFLSYSFVLYKLLQIEGQNEYLRYFPLLKSRDKLYQQEIIWQKICGDTGWPFIRSM